MREGNNHRQVLYDQLTDLKLVITAELTVPASNEEIDYGQEPGTRDGVIGEDIARDGELGMDGDVGPQELAV